MTHVTGQHERADGGEVFEALADGVRRATLLALEDAGEPLSVRELAVELANRLDGPDEPGGGQPSVEELCVSLHHRHVPKLAAAGLARYDADRKRVALTEDALERNVVEANLPIAGES